MSNFEFVIEADASAAFARLSGDFNPLHLDPVAARRTQFGHSVVHGIHLVLRTLDHLAVEPRWRGQMPVALTTTFSNPVVTGTRVAVRVTAVDGSAKLRFSAEAAGKVAYTGTIELGPAGTEVTLPDLEFAATSPRQQDFPPAVTEETLELMLKRSKLTLLFPNLGHDPMQAGWIADVLATTRIVGMLNPGMDSIYSTLKLVRNTGNSNASPTLRYKIERSDARFRLIKMSITGCTLSGGIDAFFRPRPVAQRQLKELMSLISPQTFANQRALVVGGSRGLGELTAKIIAAGGGDVTITYARGAADAEQICREADALGLKMSARQLDVLSERPDQWLAATPFSHVYFFASQPIAKNASGRFSYPLFESFAAMYVRAVALLIEQLRSLPANRQLPLRFLYPSSVFVEEAHGGFAEYVAAKAAGEALCDQLAAQHNIKIAKPRLPRMRTDQTSGLSDSETLDPLPVLQQMLNDFCR